MKVLILTDSPNITTGMGRVGREIALGLYKRRYDVAYLGWFSSMSVPNTMPFRIHPTNNMYYGSDIFNQVIEQESPDVVLTIGDIWMVDYIANPNVCRYRRSFKWVGYSPIDGHTAEGKVPPPWVNIYRDMDCVVAYTEYGKRIIQNSALNLRVEVISHGVDTKVYHPISADEIQVLKKKTGLEDKICFLMVARNQTRKNIPEFCAIWKQFKYGRRHEKARFWPHMAFRDPMGWRLKEIFDIYDIWDDLVYFKHIADSSSNINLVPEKDLNCLYNICDIFILLSGEGFGLPTLEAMACGKPVILLDHSANTELGQGRGELVKCSPHFTTGVHSTQRPYPDAKDLLEKMDKLYRDERLRQEYGQKGYEFAQQMTWDNAVDKWDSLLKRIENPFREPLELEEVCI